MSNIKYRKDIDGLRALAVLSVIIYHAFPNFLPGGFAGVDIFFVISGYLITRIILVSLDKDNFTFSEFYLKRVKRLFPALGICLGLTIILGWFVLLPDDYSLLGKHTAGGASFIANFLYLFEDGYFDILSEKKPLLHLWSLGIEEQFYFVWPIIIIISYRIKKSLLPLISLALGTTSLIYCIMSTNDYSSMAFFSPASRFWELNAGCLLAIFKHPNISAKTSLLSFQGPILKILQKNLSLLGLFLIVSSIYFFTKENFPGAKALIPVFGTVLIIASPSSMFGNRLLSTTPLVAIGLISYPLYLLHWPILVFGKIYTNSNSPLSTLTLVLISLILAWLTYLFIEKPIRFYTKSARYTYISLVLVIISGLAGLIIYLNHGFPSRINEPMRSIISKKINFGDFFRQGTCFLKPEQHYKDFKKCEAIEKDKFTNKAGLLLWGDSTAAHLYPGLMNNISKKYNIIQRTASLCPPLMNYSSDRRPNCLSINKGIRKFIKKNPPQVVVLAASWLAFPKTYQNITNTVNFLNKQGIKEIYIFGPAPYWKKTLSDLLYYKFKEDPKRLIPKRLKNAVKNSSFVYDKKMKDLLKDYPSKYISSMDILCNKDGCLTLLGEKANTLVSRDTVHFSDAGSIFVIKNSLLDLLKKK
jgi:peptidoglycan/LPS O-acetylase OafA/YrhL